jgi:uncharacterized protein (TIGR03435 family)
MRFTSLFCLGALLAHSQTFEVASVKPSAPYKGGPIHIEMSGGPGTDDPGRLTFSNYTMKGLLVSAFDMDPDRIMGPTWLNNDMFDVTAKLPPSTAPDQMRAMLRNLLTERFGLTTHREKQDLPAYVLKVGKGGPTMKASDTAPPAGKAPASGTKSSPGVTRIACYRCTMERFVGMLGHPGGRFLFDETGLTGTYDFTLAFEPDFGKCQGCVVGGGNGALQPPAAPPLSVDGPPILAVAIQQQLGLKLEQKKVPLDVVVVDRIEKTPAVN